MKCQMYGCNKQATETVDIWSLCKQHADEYRKRFTEALEAQAIKRAGKVASIL